MFLFSGWYQNSWSRQGPPYNTLRTICSPQAITWVPLPFMKKKDKEQILMLGKIMPKRDRYTNKTVQSILYATSEYRSLLKHTRDMTMGDLHFRFWGPVLVLHTTALSSCVHALKLTFLLHQRRWFFYNLCLQQNHLEVRGTWKACSHYLGKPV